MSQSVFVKGITIDDVKTRDMDDAIWVELAENGGWRVTVMVADVARAVHAGSPWDELARHRVETGYFAWGSSPMLPRHLAERDLSLWPDKANKVLVVEIALGKDLVPVKVKLYRSLMKSDAKLAYSDIPGILADPGHPQHEVVERARRLAMGLLTLRRNRGALVFYDLENGWVTSEEGSLKQLKHREDTVGYIIVQELMILANSAVAEYAVKNEVPLLYRNHTARAATPQREALMALIESAKVAPIENLPTIQHTTHLMLNKAEYGAMVTGHFGLNLPAYAHFTSPIRRYTDLVNHRQVRAFIENVPLPYTKEDVQAIAAHINKTLVEREEARSERMRKKADREAEDTVQISRVDDASPTVFERITKLQIRSGTDCSTLYRDAFKERLALDRVPPLCAALVLTQAPKGDGWADLKAVLLEWLAEAPHRAVTILNLAEQNSKWPRPTYQMSEEGPDYCKLFRANASIRLGDKAYESSGFVDTSKKGAVQRASVGLLATALGLSVPEMNAIITAPALASEEKEPAIDTSEDPIVALQEYCQAKGYLLPAYTFKIDGPPHMPTITCTCKFDSVEKTGQTANKQDAKRAAAKAMAESLWPK